MPWSSLVAKCTWWCCRIVMGALTTIQWALNTKCFKYWAAWQTEPAGSHWNVRAGLCLMFSNPSHIPLQLSSLQRVPKSWSFLIWKLCCPLNQLCKTFCSTSMFPSDMGTKSVPVTQKNEHTLSCSVWGPSWSPCRFYEAVLAAGHSQKLSWAGWFYVQWRAGMNR